jgi:glucose-1-phosphate cytidylyltransferase
MMPKTAIILAGGLGSRLQEETSLIPKPMVTIGERPMLWHIMRIFDAFGVRRFIICLGYKGYVIKEYFANYALHGADFVVNTRTRDMTILREGVEDWEVVLLDTGEATQTGGRLRRVREWISEPVFVTYGDGLADVDLHRLAVFHATHGRHASMTTVIPPGRFGAVEAHQGIVQRFLEKPAGDGGRINGGFFLFDPQVFDRFDSDSSILEEDVLPRLAAEGQLMSFEHEGFWQAMDTLRDRRQLEGIWASGEPPWLVSGRRDS